MSRVTIGFFPRERFSLAAASLKKIFECTEIPFELILINCNIPNIYWCKIENILKGRSNYRIIHLDHYVLPEESKNIILQESQSEFVCFIENDVFVQKEWLSQMLLAAQEYPADVVIPMILEGESDMIHWDYSFGQLTPVEADDKAKWKVSPHKGKLKRHSGRQTIEMVSELHCLLFRRSVFDTIGLFDGRLNNREALDLAMKLHNSNIKVVMESECEVTYFKPSDQSSLQPEERDFFLKRWDINQAEKSCQYIQDKWNLLYVPGNNLFARYRTYILKKPTDSLIAKHIEKTIPEGKSLMLVGYNHLERNSRIFTLNNEIIPFPRRNDQYSELPEDDKDAIQELERLRMSGVNFIVFLWSCFWWLDSYRQFNKHLVSNYSQLVYNGNCIIFKLD